MRGLRPRGEWLSRPKPVIRQGLRTPRSLLMAGLGQNSAFARRKPTSVLRPSSAISADETYVPLLVASITLEARARASVGFRKKALTPNRWACSPAVSTVTYSVNHLVFAH